MDEGLAGVGILVGPKGRGSNMAAIIRACQAGEVPGVVRTVIAPSASSPALETARELEVPTQVTPYGEEYPARLIEALKECRWLCLAGFMRILPVEVLRHLEGRVLNIHPGLLPKHGGKGMYGHFVHEAVIAAGDTESGCTVHYVTEEYDEGPPILQMTCPVYPDDTPDTLAARVLALEHQAYPAALAKAIRDSEVRV